MACSCYYRDAAKAKGKIEDCEEDIQKYEDFITDAESAISALEKYSSFLKNLGAQCQFIKPTGEPFDLGKSSSIASSIDAVISGTLTPMKTDASDEIERLERIIVEQQAIVDNVYTCSACLKARERARAKQLALMEQKMEMK